MVRNRLIILGSGFGALTVLKKLDLQFYETTVVSPRNHFLFTPLLPSTTVGTIEFRSIIEPIRRARKGTTYLQGECTALDDEKQIVKCEHPESKEKFELSYNLLVIAVGAWNNTFGIKG